jgi:hypothetical protein
MSEQIPDPAGLVKELESCLKVLYMSYLLVL